MRILLSLFVFLLTHHVSAIRTHNRIRGPPRGPPPPPPPCQVGQYLLKAGTTDCQPCPAGTNTLMVNSVGRESCLPCPYGTWAANAGERCKTIDCDSYKTDGYQGAGAKCMCNGNGWYNTSILTFDKGTPKGCIAFDCGKNAVIDGSGHCVCDSKHGYTGTVTPDHPNRRYDTSKCNMVACHFTWMPNQAQDDPLRNMPAGSPEVFPKCDPYSYYKGTEIQCRLSVVSTSTPSGVKYTPSGSLWLNVPTGGYIPLTNEVSTPQTDQWGRILKDSFGNTMNNNDRYWATSSKNQPSGGWPVCISCRGMTAQGAAAKGCLVPPSQSSGL